MRITYLLAAALAAICVAGSASAANYLFQWDDSTSALIGTTYKDGTIIQSVNVGNEQYTGGYGLWDGATLVDDVYIATNIFESDGSLSDTWLISGARGDGVLNFPFHSDFEGFVLDPLPGAASFKETGGWQTVGSFTVSNGDNYVWQFRSDVPEPASWMLMVAGFGIVGSSLRRRKVATVVA